MSEQEWMAATKASYDTVASNYAALMQDALTRLPAMRGILALFAELAHATGGQIIDVGCGPGHVTAHLHNLGFDIFGIDLSPKMIDIARKTNPGIRFEVASMTDLMLTDSSVGAVVAMYSVIHIPDGQMPSVFSSLCRVLSPGGILLVGFHVGDAKYLKTQGYGGLPMNAMVYRRPLQQLATWLRDAGLVVEIEIVLDPNSKVPGGILIARRPAVAASSTEVFSSAEAVTTPD